jgi:putative aminopeptidase FrvX
MLNRIEKYLSDVAMIPALAGHEQKMAAYMRKEFETLNYPTKIDTFGNVIAKLEGKDKYAPVIMVFAHMDSLGFLVRYIEEDGFIRIERLGGIPEKVLPATAIQVQCRDGSMVDGVIGVKAHHITPAEEKYVVDKYMNLFVDIGAKSKEEVLELGINIGSPIVYKPKFQKLLGTRVLMSHVDDRGGCTTVLELANLLKDNPQESTIYLVGTVQEEYNLRGAMMAARTIKPDIAISIDGGGGNDTPNMKGSGDVKCGHGPTMSLYNFHGRGTLNGTIPHPAMVRLFEEAAERIGISFQRSAKIGGLTDLAYVQLEGKGVYAIDVGYPGRYTHSPCEFVDMSDLEKLSLWVFDVLKNINRDTDFSR